jgi:broad-specificity NMP kinase
LHVSELVYKCNMIYLLTCREKVFSDRLRERWSRARIRQRILVYLNTNTDL